MNPTQAKRFTDQGFSSESVRWSSPLLVSLGFALFPLIATESALALSSRVPSSSFRTTEVVKCVGDLRSYTPRDDDRSEFADKAREGVRLFVAGQYQAAIDVLTAAIFLQPDNPMAYYHRGIAYQRLKAYDQALSDFTVVIEKGEPIDFAYLNRGAIRVKLGFMKEAESDFDAALKINPSRPDTYFNRALLFLKTNRGEEAIENITKGIGFNPQDPKAYFLRASALETYHRHDEARRDLDQALKLDPNLMPARALLKRLDHQ